MIKRFVSILMALVLIMGLSVVSLALPASVGAKGCIVIDADSGRVLYEYNAYDRLPMASTTKIMSAMLALEYEDLDTFFEVDSGAVHVEGSSMGLVDGDMVTMRALVYGMLLPSGNDAANAAAVKIAGSQQQFADLMNQKAESLGLKDTHFVTPSGLDAEGHYTTAYDLAQLTRVAMQNEDFKEICGLYRAQVEFGNPPFKRYLLNHNKLLNMYEGCTGVKTGFTDNAKRCLVSSATRDGKNLICVTLNAPDDWNIHQSLYNELFSNLTSYNLLEQLGQVTVPVAGGQEAQVKARPMAEVFASLLPGELEKVRVQVDTKPMVYAPVAEAESLGTVSFYLEDTLLGQTELGAMQEIKSSYNPEDHPGLWDKIKSFFGGLFG